MVRRVGGRHRSVGAVARWVGAVLTPAGSRPPLSGRCPLRRAGGGRSDSGWTGFARSLRGLHRSRLAPCLALAGVEPSSFEARNHVSRNASREQPPLVGARPHRRRPVRGHHGHVNHRRGSAEDADRPWFRPRGPVVGVQRLRGRVRRVAAARRPPVGPARRPQGVHRRLGRPARRVGCRRCRRQRRRRACGPRRSGRRCRSHRAVRADPADGAVRRQRQGAHQGPRAVRRGRSGRRDRRGVPRRGPHRVRVVAVGVLPEHPHRTGCHRSGATGDAGRPGQPRQPRLGGRRHRHRRARRARVRHRPRPRGRLGLRCRPWRSGPARSPCSGCSWRCRPSSRQPLVRLGIFRTPGPRRRPTSRSSCWARHGCRCGSS